MKKSRLELSEDRGGEYMYSKPDAKIKKENSPPPPHDTDIPEQDSSCLTAQTLRGVYPDLLDGDRFMTFVSKKLRPLETFCALACRADKEEINSSQNDREPLVDAAEVLDKTCTEEDGFFGLPEPGILAGFFPGKDADEGLILANKIKDTLKKSGKTTVSIGVSQYPEIRYKKSDILKNCYKALDHAAYFGPDSAVAFDSVSLNISGDKLYQECNIAGAIAEFQRALQIDPENTNVHNSLGVCHAMEGEHEKALVVFKTAAKIDPNDVMLLYNAGLVELELKNTREALKYFQKAENLDQNHFEVAFQIGRIHINDGQFEKALPYLEKAVALAPESGPANRFLGECLAALQMHGKAVKAYSKAIKINAHDAASLSALGSLYAEKGENLEIAHLFCSQSVELSPETGIFRYRLGKVLEKLERLDEAATERKKAAELGYEPERKLKAESSKLKAESSKLKAQS